MLRARGRSRKVKGIMHSFGFGTRRGLQYSSDLELLSESIRDLKRDLKRFRGQPLILGKNTI